MIPGGVRTDKACAAPDCNKWARRNGLFCSDACRARTWKRRHPEYQHPPSPKARQNGAERRSPGGLQASLGRIEATALRVLRGEPAYLSKPTAALLARTIAVESLPPKQRARLKS
jgi:hypothetical protein